MNKQIVTATGSWLALFAAVNPANTAGCLKGKLVGGVGGAVGGCIVGHHMAKAKAKEWAMESSQHPAVTPS